MGVAFVFCVGEGLTAIAEPDLTGRVGGASLGSMRESSLGQKGVMFRFYRSRSSVLRGRRCLVGSAAAVVLAGSLVGVGGSASADIEELAVEGFSCSVGREIGDPNGREAARFWFECGVIPQGKEVRLKVVVSDMQPDEYSDWAHRNSPGGLTPWIPGFRNVALEKLFEVRDVGSSDPSSSFVIHTTGVHPHVGLACEAYVIDGKSACWTPKENVIVKLRVEEKFIENPAYYQVDASGNVVDPGRNFDTESTIVMEAGHTLVMRSATAFMVNRVKVTSVEAY